MNIEEGAEPDVRPQLGGPGEIFFPVATVYALFSIKERLNSVHHYQYLFNIHEI